MRTLQLQGTPQIQSLSPASQTQFSCSWFESRYPSNESLEFPRKSGSFLTPSSGPIWRLVTRLVTRNPHGARFAVVSADEVRTRPRWFAWVRATHLSGVEAHARIEVEGLRRCDVHVTSRPATVLVAGTIKQSKANGLYRKNILKRSRQKRRVALPSFSAGAIRRQLAIADRDPEAFLFSTKTGRPLSVSNYERLLRTFVDDNAEALRRAGIDPTDFSTHIFRRTTATIIDAAAGITLASRLLGHANEQVTRSNYVVTAEMVDPGTADNARLSELEFAVMDKNSTQL